MLLLWAKLEVEPCCHGGQRKADGFLWARSPASRFYVDPINACACLRKEEIGIVGRCLHALMQTHTRSSAARVTLVGHCAAATTGQKATSSLPPQSLQSDHAFLASQSRTCIGICSPGHISSRPSCSSPASQKDTWPVPATTSCQLPGPATP